MNEGKALDEYAIVENGTATEVAEPLGDNGNEFISDLGSCKIKTTDDEVD